ncbi:Serine/threonine-protein kinase 17B [Frankliniella fusca]|uniref:non-specific serine/threonine protein kinase n=1 Tax=Frankliniella fusca TaxID=407009 RepID=A0AAE1LR43_9NEOP|nr:Serine/threonine-protein kinase 17B [Frankliniella fusca]
MCDPWPYRGKYATVRRCRCRRTGQQFAAKVVRKRRRSADLRAEILHEVAVLDACRGCPRIVRLHSVFESHSDMVLLLELAAGGELQMVLDRDEVPEEREVARLMRQILHGLIYLHEINVAHLDLKENENYDKRTAPSSLAFFPKRGFLVRLRGSADPLTSRVLDRCPGRADPTGIGGRESR